MIIGNNNINNHNTNNNNNNFSQKNKFIINQTIENERIKQHTNVNSKNEMNSKAYAMLQDRYQQGLISLDEFTKKCNELRKKI